MRRSLASALCERGSEPGAPAAFSCTRCCRVKQSRSLSGRTLSCSLASALCERGSEPGSHAVFTSPLLPPACTELSEQECPLLAASRAVSASEGRGGLYPPMNPEWFSREAISSFHLEIITHEVRSDLWVERHCFMSPWTLDQKRGGLNSCYFF